MSPQARGSQERREAAQGRRLRRADVDDPDIVMAAAAGFLAVRPRSVEETRRRLNRLGYRSSLCDVVVDRLVELRYLDDADFARAWVESRDRAKPRGASALRRELVLKGVPDDTIAAVLQARSQPAATTDDPERDAGDADHIAAQRLLERKGSSLRRETDPRRRRQRAYALLARNGFAPDICHEVASRVAIPEAEDVA